MTTTAGCQCEKPVSTFDALARVLPLCGQHRQAVLNAAEAVLDRQAVRSGRAERMARRRSTVVYFLRRSNGDIKIGFTGFFDQRLATLRGEHGPLDILLVAQGGRMVEGFLHRRFAHARIGGTEWFKPRADLLAFIGGFSGSAVAA